MTRVCAAACKPPVEGCRCVPLGGRRGRCAVQSVQLRRQPTAAVCGLPLDPPVSGMAWRHAGMMRDCQCLLDHQLARSICWGPHPSLPGSPRVLLTALLHRCEPLSSSRMVSLSCSLSHTPAACSVQPAARLRSVSHVSSAAPLLARRAGGPVHRWVEARAAAGKGQSFWRPSRGAGGAEYRR